MKKVFWGYDIAETEEVIDSLRSQNDVLSAKLINLNMELSSLKEATPPVAAVASPKVSAPTPVMPEIRSSFSAEERLELEKLRSANQRLLEENSQLNSELSGTKSELKTVKEDLNTTKTELLTTKGELMGTKAELNSGRREVKDVGQLCLKAYSDMEEMKAGVSSEMQEQIGKFSAVTAEAGEKMALALENIRSAKVQTTEYLISSYEAMLENLEVFIAQSNNIENTLAPVEEVKDELMQKVNEMMYRSSADMKKWLPEDYAYGGGVEGPSEKDPRNLPPLLTKAIHNLRKYGSETVKTPELVKLPDPVAEPCVVESQAALESISDQPYDNVIGISTKVKAKDVFGKF